MNIEKPTYHQKSWGSELWITNNGKYCGKKLTISKNKQCSLHYHKLKDETFFVLGGWVEMIVASEVLILKSGDTIHIPPMTPHRFKGLSDTIMIEVSTEHFESDSYRFPRYHEVEQTGDMSMWHGYILSKDEDADYFDWLEQEQSQRDDESICGYDPRIDQTLEEV